MNNEPHSVYMFLYTNSHVLILYICFFLSIWSIGNNWEEWIVGWEGFAEKFANHKHYIGQ